MAASSNWYSRSAPACADGSSDNNLLTDSVESCAAVNPCNETEKKKEIYRLVFWGYIIQYQFGCGILKMVGPKE